MGEAPDKVRNDGERELPAEGATAADGERSGSQDVGGSTVQLRVRDVDSKTTVLRIPTESAEPVEAKGQVEESDAAALDPRLAMRDADDETPAEEAQAEHEPEADAPAEPVDPEPEPEPELEPELVLVAVAAVTAPEPTPTPAVAPTPTPAPAPAPGPETTSEALEVLAGLSGRPVSRLRRALKRITIWTVFAAVVLGAVVTAQLLRPLPGPQTRMTTAGSFTFTGDPLALPWPAKGQAAAEVVGLGSLGSSGPDTPVPIASVTKVMNAYLILKDHPLRKGESGPAITVDQAAAQESGDSDQSTAKVTEGQQISEYEALEMLMLPSANNIARLLARWDAGSEDAFVKKMNDQATAFGMTSTTYADAAGYNNNTKSTAKDQLKLAEQVIQSDIFRQIVAEPDATIGGTRIYNTNALLSPKNGIIGTKTGSSTPAGSCLMWAAVKDVDGTRQTILGVTLGQPPTATDNILKAAQTVSAKIITAGQDALGGQVLARQGDVVGYVDDGLGGKAPVVAGKDVTVAGWTGVTATLTLSQGPGSLGHSAQAGTQVGTITAGEGSAQVQVPVLLQHDLAPPSIMSRLTRLL
ncbi:D-alanyl-D-alanine carboxypeptidase (penicillin-binding protein 5/6) [Kitasatospora sp. MAP12-15]|uniref:D-alanyl-D-alanine carboxypeptidase family protein n=1 Tax=unclassified Kitasatospora TaxID=2633591 RepID=UPI002472F0AE|nr:D-alanyl-D-alanine carboxypeptidase [Kitasatospora sp. MAP12-44]MDH6112414.1 D-alanyl-D-alanine carboxypeptidase (penicillin-binding protein 5/6) [Kitasatospora sp. MAP12-44]